jgi:hypothetical protein
MLCACRNFWMGAVGGEREDLRDEAVDELRGGAGDLRRLPEQQEDGVREGVGRHAQRPRVRDALALAGVG